MQKRAANHYLSFTRKERNGTVFLLVIILLLISIPFIYPLVFKENPVVADNNFQTQLASLKSKQEDSLKKFTQKNYGQDNVASYSGPAEKKYNDAPRQAILFQFDPNTLSEDGWKKLGVKEKTITTIKKYLSKGGKFRKPEDIEKIWGLREDEVKLLMPYVTINQPDPVSHFSKAEFTPVSYERKPAVVVSVDVNVSDTNAWIALPGIGAKLSNRIINFRNRLGGFYSIDQVAETFGLPDSVFQKIKPRLVLSNRNIKQLNINTATPDEMKQHPYIRYNLANLIFQYRAQHGNFSKVADIKKIMTVTDEIYNKVSAYLVTE